MSSTDDYKYNVHDISKGGPSLDTHRAKQPPSTDSDTSFSHSSSSPRAETADEPPIESLDLLDDAIAGGNTEEDFGIVGSLFADKAGNGKMQDKNRNGEKDQEAGKEKDKDAAKDAAKAKAKAKDIASKPSAGKQSKPSRKEQKTADGKNGSNSGGSPSSSKDAGGAKASEREVKKALEKKVADWTKQQQRNITPQEKAEGQTNIQQARQKGNASGDGSKGASAVRDAGATADSVAKPAVDAADQGFPQGDIKDNSAPESARAATDAVTDAVTGARAAPSSDHHADLTSNLGLKRVLSDKEKADKAEEIYDAMRLGRSGSHDADGERERGDGGTGKNAGMGAGAGAQRTPRASRDQFPHSRSSSTERGGGKGTSKPQQPSRTASRSPSREGENEGPEGAHDLEWARRREEMDAKNREKMATEGLDLAKTGKGTPKLGKGSEDAGGAHDRCGADIGNGATADQKPASKADAGSPADSQRAAPSAPTDVVPASKAAPAKAAPAAAAPRQPQQPPAKRGGGDKDKGKSKAASPETEESVWVGKEGSAPGERERKEPEQRKGGEVARGTPPRLQQVDLTNADGKPSEIAPQKDATAQDTGAKPATAPAKEAEPASAKAASSAGGKPGQAASEKAAANMPMGKVPPTQAGKQQQQQQSKASAQSQEPREGVLARAIHGLRDTLASGLGIGKSAPSQEKKTEKPAESGKSSAPRQSSGSSAHPHPIPGTAGPAGGATTYMPAPDDLQSTMGALGMPLSPASRHHADAADKGPIESKAQAKSKDAGPAASSAANADTSADTGKDVGSGKKEASPTPAKDAKAAASGAPPQISKSSSAAPTSPVATLPTAVDSKKALMAKAPPSSSGAASTPTAAGGDGAGAAPRSRPDTGAGARGGGAEDEMKSERREAPSSGGTAPTDTGMKAKPAPSPAAASASPSTSAAAPAATARAPATAMPGLERIPELLSRIAGASGKPRASGKCDPEYLLSQQDSLFDKYGQAVDDNTLDVVPPEQQGLPSAIADSAIGTGTSVNVGLLPALATIPMLYHGLTGKTEHPQPLYGYGGEGTTRATAPVRTAVIATPATATATAPATPIAITTPTTRLHETSIRDRDAVRLVQAPAVTAAASPVVVEQDKGILDRMAEAFKDLFSPQLSTEATNTPLRLVDEHGMHVLGADINTARIPPSSATSTSIAPSSLPVPSPSAPSPVPVDIDPYVLPTGEVLPIHTRPLLDMEKRDQILQRQQHQYQQQRQWQATQSQPQLSPASLQPRPIPVPAALVHEAIAPVQHTHARIDEEGRLVEVPVKRHSEPGYIDERGAAWKREPRAHAPMSQWDAQRDNIDRQDGWSRTEAENYRRQGTGDDFTRRERSVMLSGYDHVKQQPVWRREIEEQQAEDREAMRRHIAEREDVRRYEQRQLQRNKQQQHDYEQQKQQQQYRYSTQYAPQPSDDYYTYVASAPTTSRVFTPRAADTPTPTPANTYFLATGTAPVSAPGTTTTTAPPPPHREGLFARLRDAIFGPPKPSPQQQQRDATAARMGMHPAPPSSSTAVGDGHAAYTRTSTDTSAGADVVTSGPHGYPMFRPQFANAPVTEQWHTQSGSSSDGKRGSMWVMTPEGWVDLATAEATNFNFTHPIVMPYTGTSTVPADTQMQPMRMQRQAGRTKEMEVVPQRHSVLEERLMRLQERPQQRGWNNESTWSRADEDNMGIDKTHTSTNTVSSHPEDVYLNTSAFISREIGKVKGTNVHTGREARSDMQTDTNILVRGHLASTPVLIDKNNGTSTGNESGMLGWSQDDVAARVGGVGGWHAMRGERVSELGDVRVDSHGRLFFRDEADYSRGVGAIGRRDGDSGACLHYTPTLR